MSSYIPNLLRSQVIERANNRCEYCCLSQVGQEATFHIDHVKPIKNGGKTTIDNLALACVSCSLPKSARELAPDPESKKTVPIFNPRQQEWSEHFQWAGGWFSFKGTNTNWTRHSICIKAKSTAYFGDSRRGRAARPASLNFGPQTSF